MVGEPSMPLGHKDPCVIVKTITRPDLCDPRCVGFAAFGGGFAGSMPLLVTC